MYIKNQIKGALKLLLAAIVIISAFHIHTYLGFALSTLALLFIK